VTVATRADWIIWVNQDRRTPASPKMRWKCGSQRGQVEQGDAGGRRAVHLAEVLRAAQAGVSADSRQSAALLYQAIRTADRYQYETARCEDRVALLEWNATGRSSSIRDRVDQQVD
jgi:hypothetical protein